jgi:hypothetical protein
MLSRRAMTGAFLAASALALPATAQEGTEQAEKVHIHGFGSWAYGRTNGNEYLGAGDEGSYDDASLALNVTADVSKGLRMVTQAEWLDDAEGTEVEFDYAFVEWEVSSRLKLRVGKVKQPFGISTEVLDVGTLRPFLDLPQAIYGGVGLISETYKGVGFTGAFELSGGWALNYDVYGGGQELEEFLPIEDVLEGEELEEASERERTRDMVGGRLVVDAPLGGLRFGGSAYTGVEIGAGRRSGQGLQAEYLTGKWSLRTELARETVEDTLTARGLYAEAAYHFTPHWQGAVQYGRFTAEVEEAAVSAPSFLRHEEVAVGLNYWRGSSFVIKASFHRVDGNRLAGPGFEHLADAIADGALEPRTNLVRLGAQFSF